MDELDGERETQNFMNVESLSQLPFFRRPPSKDKTSKPIRLFGKYFTGGDYFGDDHSNSSETNNKEDKEKEEENQTGDNGKDNSMSNINRRFECHYCFRNFLTSQALGGHQNAHKRERQLTKRGTSSYFHHPQANLYGYHHYPSWSSGSLPSARFYGGHTLGTSSSNNTRPINGSPLGQWRVPPSSSSVRGSNNSKAAFTSPGSLLVGSQPHPPLHVSGSSAQNRMSSYRYGLRRNVQDNVNLDLHL